jgi:mannose-6-phosphate isomerase-like protein (cupin superfamily)
MLFDLKSFPGKTQNFYLTPVELKDFIDFEVKRIYYINQITDANAFTGAHCHHNEKEFFMVLNGSTTIMIDRGQGLEEIPLTTNQGIFIDNYIWHHFKDMQPGTIILALSSTNYNPDRSDYIESYDDYLKIRDEKLLNRNK